MQQATSVLIESFSKGLQDIRNRISEVKYRMYSEEDNVNSITFLFDGVRYNSTLEGRNVDLVLTDDLEKNRVIAVRTLLDGYAKK